MCSQATYVVFQSGELQNLWQCLTNETLLIFINSFLQMLLPKIKVCLAMIQIRIYLDEFYQHKKYSSLQMLLPKSKIRNLISRSDAEQLLFPTIERAQRGKIGKPLRCRIFSPYRKSSAGTETVFFSEDYFYFFSLLERQAGKEETAGEKHGKPLRCCVFFFLLVDFVAAHDKNLLTCYLFFI